MLCVPSHLICTATLVNGLCEKTEAQTEGLNEVINASEPIRLKLTLTSSLVSRPSLWPPHSAGHDPCCALLWAAGIQKYFKLREIITTLEIRRAGENSVYPDLIWLTSGKSHPPNYTLASRFLLWPGLGMSLPWHRGWRCLQQEHRWYLETARHACPLALPRACLPWSQSMGLRVITLHPTTSFFLLPANVIIQAPGVTHSVGCQTVIKNKNSSDFL